MSLPFGPPQPVSPLIRGARWVLLFAGIVYARGKQKMYTAMEESHREEEAKKKIIRDRELAIIKKRIAAEERETVRQIETGELFRTDEDKENTDPDVCPGKPKPVLVPECEN